MNNKENIFDELEREILFSLYEEKFKCNNCGKELTKNLIFCEDCKEYDFRTWDITKII